MYAPGAHVMSLAETSFDPTSRYAQAEPPMYGVVQKSEMPNDPRRLIVRVFFVALTYPDVLIYTHTHTHTHRAHHERLTHAAGNAAWKEACNSPTMTTGLGMRLHGWLTPPLDTLR